MTPLSHSNCSTIYNGKKLALLIKVVRDMVFTLGKWSFSKKLGKLPFTTVRAATKGLGSKTNGWIHSILVTEGQQKVHLPNLLQGSLQDLIKNYNSPDCADQRTQVLFRAKRSSTGQKQWQHSGTYWERRAWRVTTITNLEQCEWLLWTFSSVALSNMKSMIYELVSYKEFT